MMQRSVPDICSELKVYLLKERGRQKALSKETGVHQSIISRYAGSSPPKTVNKTLRTLCVAVGIKIENSMELDPSKNKTLMNALQAIWDGSDEQAIVISKILTMMPLLKQK